MFKVLENIPKRFPSPIMVDLSMSHRPSPNVAPGRSPSAAALGAGWRRRPTAGHPGDGWKSRSNSPSESMDFPWEIRGKSPWKSWFSKVHSWNVTNGCESRGSNYQLLPMDGLFIWKCRVGQTWQIDDWFSMTCSWRNHGKSRVKFQMENRLDSSQWIELSNVSYKVL